MVWTIGVPSAVGGWITYGIMIYTNVEDYIPLSDDLLWVKHVITLIPLIAGHHVLAWRIHGQNN